MPVFRSRFALWLIRLSLAVPFILVLGWPIFEMGGCTLGLTHRGGCAHIPDWFGEWALMGAFGAYIIGLFVTPILVLVGVLIEIFARR